MTPHAKDSEIWIEAIRSVCYPSVYMDIGAGDGFDCGVVKTAFPLARCIAIEPVEAWEIGPPVELHRDTIAATNEPRIFHVKGTPGIHGLYSRTSHGDDHIEAVHARTLEHFCEREHVECIDAMKIDVEGAAWDVLVGAGSILGSVKVIHVETEWVELFKGQHLEHEVFNLLERSGMVKTWENRVEDLGQGDSIWVRQ